MKTNYKRLIAMLLALVLIFGSVAECFAASKTTKAKNLTLSSKSGTVTVTNASGKKQTVKSDMRLYSGYTIKTGKKSYATVSLDSTKAIKIDALSEVEIRKSGKKLEIYLVDGSLFCNVDEKLKSDETLNIRTNTMITGIRGTSVQFDVSDESFAAKFFDGYGETVDMATNETYTVNAGDKFVVEEQAVELAGETKTESVNAMVEMEDITEELSASAAEEILNNEALAARIAKTFDTTADDIVKDINENLAQMQQRDEALQEAKEEASEKAAEEAAKSATSISKIVEQGKSSTTSTNAGTYYAPTTYTVSLPKDVQDKFCITDIKEGSTSLTKNANNKYTVKANSVLSFTVNTTDASVQLSFNGVARAASTAAVQYYETEAINEDINVTVEITGQGQGQKTHHSGNVANSSTMTIEGEVEYLDGLTNNSNGVINVSAGAVLTVHGAFINSNIINNYGTIILASGCTLTNQGNGVITVASGSTIETKQGSTINNYALIKAENLTESETIVTGAGTYTGNCTIYFVETSGDAIIELTSYNTSYVDSTISPSSVEYNTFISNATVNTVKSGSTIGLPNLTNTHGTYHTWFTAYVTGSSVQFLAPSISGNGANASLILQTYTKGNAFANSVIWVVPVWYSTQSWHNGHSSWNW